MADQVYSRKSVNEDAVRTFLEEHRHNQMVNLDVGGNTSEFYVRDLAILFTEYYPDDMINSRVALAAYQAVVDVTSGISLEEGENHPYRNQGLAARVRGFFQQNRVPGNTFLGVQLEPKTQRQLTKEKEERERKQRETERKQERALARSRWDTKW
jgi:hypothetical protein